MLQINSNIKKYRNLRKLSQQEMADLLDEKRSTYAEWEKNIVPRADIFYRICEILEVSWETMMGIDDDKPSIKKTPELKQLTEVEFYRDKVLTNLDLVFGNVSLARAEIRGSIEYVAIKDAKGDELKRAAIMEQISKLIELNLPVAQQVNIQAS